MMVYFFNPAVWIANRLVHGLREYACDDQAVALSESSAVESGETFMKVPRFAQPGHRRLEGALGVFGLGARATCLRRCRRMLDRDRPIHARPGRWSMLGLILVAAVALPHVRAASEAPDPDATPRAAGAASEAGSDRAARATTQDTPRPEGGAATAASEQQQFELHVVGPEGNAVPHAALHLSTWSMFEAVQIRVGEITSRGSYGASVKTDAAGLLALEFAKKPERLSVGMTIPGYGPYSAVWSSEQHVQPIPPTFTAKLDAGWSIGGVVVDEQGAPVEGVTVRPRIKTKKRPPYLGSSHSRPGSKTDAEGRWRFDSVPVSMSEVSVGIGQMNSRPTSAAPAACNWPINH